MSDKHVGYVVTLEFPVNEESSAAVVAAIRQLRGVVSVEPVKDSFEHHIAFERAKSELLNKLWDVVTDKAVK